jgi:sugar lactone lactonase YvrE
MQTTRDLIGRVRFPAAAIALLILTCGTPSRAWCGNTNLWVAHDITGIASYTSGQLKKSGTPTPIQLSTFSEETGLAFDKSHNLWATVGHLEVVRFNPAQLKDLKTDPSPTPGVIITSTSTFDGLGGCNFDHQGNLWVVDESSDSIDELSKAQLAAGSKDLTPAIVITSSDLEGPSFVMFDEAGNAWVSSYLNSEIVEFSASQLTSGGSKTPNIVLSDDGSGSLSGPGEIAFDKKGNLWVPNIDEDTVVEFAKGQLTSSGDPTPTVTLSSAIFSNPWGAAFDSSGNLVVMNYGNGTIAKFTPKELKASGAPVPKVSVTGTDTENQQIIFGSAS